MPVLAVTAVLVVPFVGLGAQGAEVASVKPLLWKSASETYSKWQSEIGPPRGLTVPPIVALLKVIDEADPIVDRGGSGGSVSNVWFALLVVPP